ncbi:MAG TPA: hypothetical protein VE968_08095 [Sphingomicrobium sp.]|nr:hypothetical protein [Sphingomicrobium sp.]
MAQHGYFREYDEGWDRGDDRDRERDWRDEGRNGPPRTSAEGRRQGSRDSRNDERGERDRSGNFMFSDGEREWDRAERGPDHYPSQSSERAQSWFRDDDRQYRRTHPDEWNTRESGRSAGSGRTRGYGSFQEDYGSSQSRQPTRDARGDWERSPRNFSSHQDDHYRSWRDRQMRALDRDYEDYCREREQQFHQDFDSWRRNRQKPTEGREQQQSQGSQAPSEEVMELSSRADEVLQPRATPSPTAEATLGTNNSENSGTGRGTD